MTWNTSAAGVVAEPGYAKSARKKDKKVLK
jgi:hypothetical protein